MASVRRLGDDEVKLFIMGNKAGAGDAHEDKGSFVLEYAGDTFAMDPGTCDYAHPLSLTLKTCQRHNMLLPTGLAERPLGGSTWEACMRLAVTLEREGEHGAAALVRELGEGPSVRARELAVWLYTIAEARKRPDDALLFNALDAAWARIQQLVAAARSAGEQGRFA